MADLIKHVTQMIDDSSRRFPKNESAYIQKWSMNWYKTRCGNVKWKMTLKDKENLYSSINMLNEKYPHLTYQCIPITGENNDMCLIAVEILFSI
jgi:alpha-galactosidase